MSRIASNGRPEPEVIMNFADGFAYSKGKLDDALLNGGLFDKPAAPAPTKPQKKEDVDLIVAEMEITRAQAEKALAEHNGDLLKTLRSLIVPPGSL